MEELLVSYIKSVISVSDTEMGLILSFFKFKKLKKNERVLHHGEASQRTFFVIKGCLRIFYIDEQGVEATRYFAFENQFATALVSFITAKPSEELMQAVEPTEVFYITHENFYKLLALLPAWEKFYRIYLENAYVNNTNRLQSFFVQDALTKYRRLLEENPIIVQRLSNKLVASYLGISQATLSRLKTKK